MANFVTTNLTGSGLLELDYSGPSPSGKAVRSVDLDLHSDSDRETVRYINGSSDDFSITGFDRFDIKGADVTDTITVISDQNVVRIDGGGGIDTVTFVAGGTNVAFDIDIADTSGKYVNVEQFAGSFSDANDTIRAGLAVSNLNGGLGNDLLVVDYSGAPASGKIVRDIDLDLDSDNNAETVRYTNGSSDNFSLNGFERFDITGSSAGDSITVLTDQKVVRIDGGGGIDTVAFNAGGTSAAINVDLDDTSGKYLNIEQFAGLLSDANDRINAGFALSNLSGGVGNDLLVLDYGRSSPSGKTVRDVDLDLNSDSDSETVRYTNGSSESFSLNGFERFDIVGSAADDTISTGTGNDLIEGGAGADIMNGGGGIDEARYLKSATGVTVDLATPGLNVGDAVGDQFISIERISGSNFGDRLSGNAAGNVLLGGTGNDILRGQGGSDQLFGGADSDLLVGGNGNDALIGGAANDILIGGAGPADLTNSTGAQVYRIYQATLDRAPDAGGLRGWNDAIESGELGLLNVVSGFVASREFQNIYGDVGDSGFVTLLYNNVLDRAPDSAGLFGWLDAIDNGTTREQVVVGFSESIEFKTNTGTAASAYTEALIDADVQAGIVQSGFYDDVFRLYQATLDRAPDAAGLDGWSDQLADGRAYTTIAGGFTNSGEFRNTYGNLDDDAFINQLYRNVLDRDGDAAGVAGWRDVIANGGTREDVVRGFAQSGEFVAKTDAGFTAYMRTLGSDTLSGGQGNDVLYSGLTADTFLFNAAEDGADVVLQVDAWDTLQFTGFGYASAADALANMTSLGAGVRFADQGVQITFASTDLATLQDADYIFG